MDNKKKMIIGLISIVILFAVLKILSIIKDEQIYNENVELIKVEVPLALDEGIEEIKKYKDYKEFGISDIKYEIVDVERIKGNYDPNRGKYNIGLKIWCNANEDLTDLEKKLVAFDLEQIAQKIEMGDTFIDSVRKDRLSNGTNITIVDTSRIPDSIITIVNDEIINTSSESSYGSSSLKIEEKRRDQDAWNCATDVVENKLNRYSDINVSSYNNSTVTYNSDTEIYTIKGTVSYKNEFNAKVNYKFTVNLQLTPTGYKNASALIY